MKSHLMMLLILCSNCQLLPAQEVEMGPILRPKYQFLITPVEGENMACLPEDQVKQLFVELDSCRNK